MNRAISLLLVLTLLLGLAAPAAAMTTNYIGYTAKVGAMTLPLPEYPVGSYCTTSGEACVGHNACQRYYTTPDGTQVDTYGIQCLGFARYVFYRCFGVVDTGSGNYKSVVASVSATDTTVELLQQHLGTDVLAGAHIRAGTESNGHSMIYLGSDSTYVYTYEGNYDNHCGVTVNCRTWQELATYLSNKGGVNYIHMPNVYPGMANDDCAVNGHTLQITASIAATCTEEGTATHTCAVCGAVEITTVPALGHDWDQGIATLLPTSGREGIMTYTCQRCGETKTEAIAKLSDCKGNAACPGHKFTDMPATDSWAHTGIDFVVTYALFSGTSDTTFSPENTMTRAMLATVLWRLAGSPDPVGSNPFSDVKAGLWYTTAIIWAAENHVVNGVGGGRFAPEGNVTREQAAVMLFNYANAQGKDTSARADLTVFPDSQGVSSWSKDALSWANKAGLINGTMTDGKIYLSPSGQASRAQVAKILMQFVELG